MVPSGEAICSIDVISSIVITSLLLFERIKVQPEGKLLGQDAGLRLQESTFGFIGRIAHL